MEITAIARQAQEACRQLAAAKSDAKNRALAAIARALETRRDEIVAANRRDLALAETENLAAPLLKRLRFDEAKITEAVEGINSLVALPDPVGATLSATELDQGLELLPVPEERQRRPAQGR